jgi:hypothetical protein
MARLAEGEELSSDPLRRVFDALQEAKFGHFGCTCYHPLFLFNQFGDLERCLLRRGNAHSAEDWRMVLEPVIARYRERGIELYFRADAAFAKPEIYDLVTMKPTRG